MHMGKRKETKTGRVILIAAFLYSLLSVWECSGAAADRKMETRFNAAQGKLNKNTIEKIHRRIGGRESFTFIVLGDNRGAGRQFKTVLEQAGAHKPDFIIHTGDFTDCGKNEEYRHIIELCSRGEIPVVFCPGNHDLRGNGAQNFKQFFGRLNFVFDINGRYRFICINNNNKKGNPVITKKRRWRYENDRGIEDKSMGMIEEALHAEKKHFIIMHIPPPVGQFRFKAFTWNAASFLGLLRQKAPLISRVFCGHIHGYGEARYGDVRCVVTGGAGAPLQIGRDGIVNRFHYVLVTVQQDRVSHKLCFVD